MHSFGCVHPLKTNLLLRRHASYESHQTSELARLLASWRLHAHRSEIRRSKRLGLKRVQDLVRPRSQLSHQSGARCAQGGGTDVQLRLGFQKYLHGQIQDYSKLQFLVCSAQIYCACQKTLYRTHPLQSQKERVRAHQARPSEQIY